jgi:hypothetical protein
MGVGALNPALKKMCLKAGYLSDNTMYSFRREAASVSKASHGMEAAQELLNHVPGKATSFIHYDHQAFGTRDVTAFTLGGEEISNAALREAFSQARTAQAESEAGGGQPDLTKVINDRAEEEFAENSEVAKMASDFQKLCRTIHEKLQETKNLDEEDVFMPTNTYNANKYTTLLKEAAPKEKPAPEAGAEEETTADASEDEEIVIVDGKDYTLAALATKLEAFLKKRKTRHRDIRKVLRDEARKALQKGIKDSERFARKADKGKTAVGQEVQMSAPDDQDEEQDDEVQVEPIDAEPKILSDCPEGDVIIVEDDEEDEENEEVDEEEEKEDGVATKEWADFARSWIAKVCKPP